MQPLREFRALRVGEPFMAFGPGMRRDVAFEPSRDPRFPPARLEISMQVLRELRAAAVRV